MSFQMIHIETQWTFVSSYKSSLKKKPNFSRGYTESKYIWVFLKFWQLNQSEIQRLNETQWKFFVFILVSVCYIPRYLFMWVTLSCWFLLLSTLFSLKYLEFYAVFLNAHHSTLIGFKLHKYETDEVFTGQVKSFKPAIKMDFSERKTHQ